MEELIRLDEDIEDDDGPIPSTPASAPRTSDTVSPHVFAPRQAVDDILNQLRWNARLSPRLRRTRTPRHGTDGSTPNDLVGVDLPVVAADSILGYDDVLPSFQEGDAATPTAQRYRPFPFPPIKRGLTASPSDAYLRRKEAGSGRQRASSTASAQWSTPEGSPDDTSPVEDNDDSLTVWSGDEASSPPAVSSTVSEAETSSEPLTGRTLDNIPREQNLGDSHMAMRPTASSHIYSQDRKAAPSRQYLGPLLVRGLPNGDRLPDDWASMSREDQALQLCLSTPLGPKGEKDYEASFRGIGMPDEQLSQMLQYAEKLAEAARALLSVSASMSHASQLSGHTGSQLSTTEGSDFLRDGDSEQEDLHEVCQ